MAISFLEIKNKSDLAFYLGVPLNKLNYIVYGIDEDKLYKTFKIRKSNKSFREISSPKMPLCSFQNKIKTALDEIYKVKGCVHGYVENKSVVTNAEKHIRKRWIVKFDLSDFFGSIHFGRVQGMFQAKPFSFSKDVAVCLARICCYKGSLPQGASSSPVISNILSSGLDIQLTKLAIDNGCYYTRYADDITFSTGKKIFPSNIAVKLDPDLVEASSCLETIVAESGFSLNISKNKMLGRGERQIIAGIVVNRKVNVTKKYINQLKGMLHACDKYSVKSTAKIFFKKYDIKNRPPHFHETVFESILRGRVLYVGFVRGWRDPKFIYLAKKLGKVIPNFKLDLSKSYMDNQLKFKIYAEGRADLPHIKKALEYFQDKGQFKSLILDFDHSIDFGGYKKLYGKLDKIKGDDQKKLTICLFDQDVDNGTRNEIDSGSGYQKFAKGLYSALLPIPKVKVQVVKDNEFCIESYYNKQTFLNKDHNGRRFFLKSEFGQDGIHLKDKSIRTSKKKIGKKASYFIDECVYKDITDNYGDVVSLSIALKKNAFAKNITEEKNGFVNVDFSNFEALFDLLKEIQEDHFS